MPQYHYAGTQKVFSGYTRLTILRLNGKTEKLPKEQEVVKAAAKGDEQLLLLYMTIYFDSIYRFVYLRVEDQQTAEDITSNVFLKAWEKLDKYQFRGVPFRAWLFRIRAQRSNRPLPYPKGNGAFRGCDRGKR